MLGRLCIYCRLYVERAEAGILFLGSTLIVFPSYVPTGKDAAIHMLPVLDSAPNAIYFWAILRKATQRNAIDGHRGHFGGEQPGANFSSAGRSGSSFAIAVHWYQNFGSFQCSRTSQKCRR